MNAVTQIETRAIETAAPLEVADPTKNLILVPLSQLLPRRSKRNARKTPRLSIPELAASIARIGLLQNLVVILSADGEQYEVVAGDRRLTALKLLAKKKRIAADFEVPCLLVPDASARTVSLAENLLREQMHPADQLEAFAALVKEGRPIEDIAADFGVTPLVVQRRLKLADVSPRLLADYRDGAVTLEQLMALTITDDHAAQESAFYGAPEWQRGASTLRERLVQSILQDNHYGHDLPLGVSLKVQDRLEGMAPDWPESPAAVALRELQQVAGEALPQDSAELFAALLAMEQGELVRLLAVCVAATVDVVTPRATAHQPGAELAQAVGLDMAAWWRPTADGYFQHVPKAAILEAVGEFAPSHAARLAKLKKADIASEAERLADGTGWMPAIFKTEGPEAAPQETQEQDAPEDDEAMADEPAEALAA